MSRAQSAKPPAVRHPFAVHTPVLVPLQAVNFATYNPRRITDAELAKLKASIVARGFVTALVVQKRGMLIAGHQRVRAARELSAERGQAPVEQLWAFVLDVGDDEAKRLNVALNKIRGEFDEFMLGEVLASLGDLDQQGAAEMGFELKEAQRLVTFAGMDPDAEAAALEAEAQSLDLAGFARSVTLTLEFETVADRDAAKELLRKASSPTVKAGTVVLRSLRTRPRSAAPSPPAKPAKNGRRAVQAAAP